MDKDPRTRLDQRLVQLGLATSRTRAAEAISAGRVTVNGMPQTKASYRVGPTDQLEVRKTEREYVSRAGHKLAGALAAFPEISVRGKTCLDAGASTGGFTQVLLEAGAAEVFAVDVGHGQLVPQLREDPRVRVYERLNIRHVGEALSPGTIPLIVSDLSFISLRLVIPALVEIASTPADLLLMVKPQFEVGRDKLGKGGIVTDPAARADAVARVVQCAADHGLELRGAGRSQLPGQDGNVEFFCWFHRGEDSTTEAKRTQDLLDAVDYS